MYQKRIKTQKASHEVEVWKAIFRSRINIRYITHLHEVQIWYAQTHQNTKGTCTRSKQQKNASKHKRLMYKIKTQKSHVHEVEIWYAQKRIKTQKAS